MSGPNGAAPRLEIEQLARRSIEQIDKELAGHVDRMTGLQRERAQMEAVLKALGVEYHWEGPREAGR